MTVAHTAVRAGEAAAQSVVRKSLKALRSGLHAAGAQEGQLLKLAVGEEAAEAITGLVKILRDLASPMKDAPSLPGLLAAIHAWGILQSNASHSTAAGELQLTRLPENTERWLRFASASYGPDRLAGLVDGLSMSPVARASTLIAQGGGPGEVALALAGLMGRIEVLAFEKHQREPYMPGYLVAVDHDFGRVVVAVRGTSSLSDVLSDAVCEPVAMQLNSQEGTAHGGFWIVAQRLDGKLRDVVTEGLARLEPKDNSARGVLLCGHSLGGGVAPLLAALWRDTGGAVPRPAFLPQHVKVECVAFAPPQILDAELALAQSDLTTSIIAGDDLIPRLSLATAKDLLSALLLLSPSNQDKDSHGHAVDTAKVLAAECRGDTAALAAMHATVRSNVRTSSGRLFAPGRLLYLRQGEGPRRVSHQEVDELIISRDMVAAHMPRRYAMAIQAALEVHAGRGVPRGQRRGAGSRSRSRSRSRNRSRRSREAARQ